jgi:hypothetical protein
MFFIKGLFGLRSCIWQTPSRPILTVLVFLKMNFRQIWPYKKNVFCLLHITQSLQKLYFIYKKEEKEI